MGWMELLQSERETIVLPWLGGRSIHFGERSWSVVGPLPEEYGWYNFKLNGRKASLLGGADVYGFNFDKDVRRVVRGYLVGDRVIPDNVFVDTNPKKILTSSERVYLLAPGLDLFVRVVAGRVSDEGPLIFFNEDMPCGSETAVTDLFYTDGDVKALQDLKGVSPALEAAFRLEKFHRAEAERRRAELERLRREEEERRVLEERRQQLVKKLGDGESRRELAKLDFQAAARAALAVGNATYLRHMKGRNKNEYVVIFRMLNRRFECVCDERLRIVDSGICLVDHDSGEKGDRLFTLESLPSVILQADRERKLVVYRHVDG